MVRKVRPRIFVACEGESEVGFRAWLQDQCREHVHLDGARLRGGDPLSLVERAVAERKRSEKKVGIGHRHSLLLIDADRLDDGSVRSRQAIRLAENEDLVLIRQVPCFEGVLLRLVKGQGSAIARSPREAMTRLCKCWPEYNKPMTRERLASKITIAMLQDLAQVDGEVRRLLEILGLPQLR